MIDLVDRSSGSGVPGDAGTRGVHRGVQAAAPISIPSTPVPTTRPISIPSTPIPTTQPIRIRPTPVLNAVQSAVPARLMPSPIRIPSTPPTGTFANRSSPLRSVQVQPMLAERPPPYELASQPATNAAFGASGLASVPRTPVGPFVGPGPAQRPMGPVQAQHAISGQGPVNQPQNQQIDQHELALFRQEKCHSPLNLSTFQSRY